MIIMNKKINALSVILIMLLVGCNLPNAGGQQTSTGDQNQSPDAVYTQAAQTVAAELTRVSLLSVSTTEVAVIPQTTFTPSPTNTTTFTPTNTSIPCNLATFVTDVTIPDNTVMVPGQVFAKTWRIRNAGTCSWNSSYLLLFDHGDGLGVTSGYTQQLTSGVVNPGQSLDITVNMTAPATSGTYTGYWRMRDPGGVIFGITPSGGTFLVKIIVANALSVTLSPINPGVESGTIRDNGGPWADFTAGESNSDITKTCQAFLSYDITGFPLNATITEVKFDFRTYAITGNPFGSLGVLNAYTTDYGLSLEPADFVAGYPPGNIADWGSSGALDSTEASPELKVYLQSKIGSGRLQLRLQFAGSNGDGTKDRITFTNPVLLVTYTKP
jgi:hypothetical protein